MPMRLLAACVALAAASAHAEGPPLPLWEVGGLALGVGQQAYLGSDQRVGRGLALPYVIYRGEFLRADRESVGVRAVKRPAFEVDIGFGGAFGSSSSEIDARRGMPDLGTLVEFGPRLKWALAESGDRRWRVELPLRGVFDLDDRLAGRGLAFEPELNLGRRSPGLTWTLSAAALIGDRRLAGTFYGVAPEYATPERSAYAARPGLIGWRFGASGSRQVADDWLLFGFARVDSVAGAANRTSPLVRQTHGVTFGVGAMWTWLRSRQPAAD
jgi:outer membrane scaffolding protein for murein synthesis (MipA/OmpV family)